MKVGKDLTVGGKLAVGEVEVAARLVKAETQLAALSDYLRQVSEKGIVGEPQKMNPYDQNKAETDGIVMAVVGAPKSIVSDSAFSLAFPGRSRENTGRGQGVDRGPGTA